MTTPESPMLWKEGWVVFDAVKQEPLVFKMEELESGETCDRVCFITRTEEEGLALVRKFFGVEVQNSNYPHRFPVRPMPRDVEDCLFELADRLNLQAFWDGKTLWWVKDFI